jgi:hypothetical protein
VELCDLRASPAEASPVTFSSHRRATFIDDALVSSSNVKRWAESASSA